jgi:hypothetical protein
VASTPLPASPPLLALPNCRRVWNHGPVASESFSYGARKSGSVAISWRGRTVAILTGSAARRFLDRTRDASPSEAQLEMARVTGNFKRGNEG